MKFFIDTADLVEIRDLAATGLVDGGTPTPSLVAKTGRNFLDVVREICQVVPGPVSAEVTAIDTATMLAEGRKLAKLAKNVAVKVALTPDSLKAGKARCATGRSCSRRRRRSSPPRRARASSRPSWAGSTTSAPRAWR